MNKNTFLKKVSFCCLSFIFGIFLFGCEEKDQLTAFSFLPDSVSLVEINESLESKRPVVVGFFAAWCPHCKNYKPIFNEVKDSFKDKVTFIGFDVDEKDAESFSNRFQVRGIPTTAFVRQDGSIFKLQSGEIEKEKLIEITNDLIKSKKKKRAEEIAPFPIEELKAQQAEQEKTQDENKKDEAPSKDEQEEKPVLDNTDTEKLDEKTLDEEEEELRKQEEKSKKKEEQIPEPQDLIPQQDAE